MKTSIQTRLLLFLMLSYIPVALIILWNNQLQREQARQTAQEIALQQAHEIAFFHSQQIKEVENILLLLTNTPMVQEWDMELCNQSATDLVDDFPNWFGFGVFDAGGTVRCSTVPEAVGMNLAERPYVQGPLDTGEVAVSGYRLGTITGRYTFVVVAPIFNLDGTIRGAISIGIEPDVQSELIAHEVLRPDYRMTILDQTNIVLLRYPDPELWIGTPYSEDILQQIEGRTEGTFEGIGLEGHMRLYGFTVIEPAAVTVLVSIDKSLAFAEVNRIQQRNVLLLAATFAITSLLIMLASRLIARPLRQFSLITQQFSRGDLSKRISMNNGIEEIAQIQAAFNDMANSIEARTTERTAALVEANKQLAAEIQTRKEIETELERFTVRLRESNRDLEQFAYVASHDLRAPLRKIIGFSERLQMNNQSNEQRQDYLKRVQDTAIRMNTMIDNLLLYARIDQQHNTQTEVNLTNVAQQVCTDLDTFIKETQGSVQIEPLPTIRADLIQMHRLLQNLIANALTYNRDGVPPVVTITGQEDAETLQVRIQDNGVGIAEKNIDRIFVLFERLHGQSQGGGAGIGLAICRKIMQHHNGEITVESTVGTGSLFILTFPRSLQVPPESDTT